MSFLDKLAAAIMPPESDEDRANARSIAESLAGQDDWLALVLDHHRQIEQHFSRALTAPDGGSRQTALRHLQVLLTGHANAEESVLYPALADHGGKSHATMAYEEQAMTKVQLGLLETLDPMGEEWREKLAHVQGAVLHHVYEEEGTWFAELQQNLSATERDRLTRRFREEFDRYAGEGAPARDESGMSGGDRAGTGMGWSDELPLQQAAQTFGPGTAPSGN